MTDEPQGFKISQELVTKIVTALIAALLGTNLFHGMTSQRELTKAQSQWDTAEWTNQRGANEKILAELKSFKEKLP